jgi:hypothetical protein
MTLPNADLSVEQSVEGLLKTIEEAGPMQDLVLLNYDGATLPW